MSNRKDSLVFGIYLSRDCGTELGRDGLKQLHFDIWVQVDDFTVATAVATSKPYISVCYITDSVHNIIIIIIATVN